MQYCFVEWIIFGYVFNIYENKLWNSRIFELYTFTEHIYLSLRVVRLQDIIHVRGYWPNKSTVHVNNN